MAKPHPKPSDRGRNSPEPGPTPGTRSEQRDTEEQLAAARATGDEPLSWEREEQEKLPPRGEGSQHNQGSDKGATLRSGAPRAEDAPTTVPSTGLHTGGTRGPSNDNR